jgi:lipopolysaccharide export system permease protein
VVAEAALVKLLDRYLLRQFVGTFVLLVLALPFLFLITDLTDNLDRYLARGLEMRAVAVSYVFYLPQLVLWGFPIAALIATVFTIGNMTRHQEITAVKAGGVSFYRLVVPLVVVAGVLSVVAVGIGELVPLANQKRAELLGERERSSAFRMHIVFRTENGRTLSASRVNAQAREMSNVVLESRTRDGSMRVHQSASSATFYPASGWTMHDGYLRWLDESGEETALQFASMRVADLHEAPEELLAVMKSADEMRYAELERFIRTVERSGSDPSEFRVQLAQKVSLPLALLVIVLFGAPLATTSRRGGTAFGIGISLAVTMVYLMMFKVGEAMGTSGAISPMAAAWAPNWIFLLAAFVLLWRVRS